MSEYSLENLESPFLDAEPDGTAEADPTAVAALEAETPFTGPWPQQPMTPAAPPPPASAPEDLADSSAPEDLADSVAAERELWEAEGPSPATDASVAVPPFGFFKRLLMPVELLDRDKNATAIRHTQQWHPGASGVDPAHIRSQLAGYVNLSVVRAAIEAHNRDHPAAPIALGTPPIDAVFVEAVHQFQAKCYLDPEQADGLAGESTLDSLGFVKQRGLRTVNRVNTTARDRLKLAVETQPGAARAVRDETGGEHTDWFDHMVNPTFLGRHFNKGIHLVLAYRLRAAERWLLTLPQYAGMTPTELGRALRLDEPPDRTHDPVHKGHRPDATTNSMHTFGLAVDIRYWTNPWVKGQQFTEALRNSATLLGSDPIDADGSAAFLHRLGTNPSLTTRQIHQTLTRRNTDFHDYLTLRNAPDELRRVLAQRWSAQDWNAFQPGERQAGEAQGVAAAASRWLKTIQDDHRALRDNFDKREPADGFLNLHEDLVVALRDKACLCWGAVDIGPRESGDMMHFDTRVGKLGDILVHTVTSGDKPYPVSPGHPCLPGPPPKAPAPDHETTDVEQTTDADDIES
ncbi:hypothetical protein [Streptomyces rhizosphaericus]|uniref:Uncharacterized protein n=1 Tax=Streptomyces rhizosphaericus TaxID=114699 RepID=A0A6G4AQM8_9ACTN|nr:hypothetical protein [Streptomyces rhizosphaericus]NEW75548.1 hypothetical protein [Streptomyces rhizosphaericus]